MGRPQKYYNKHVQNHIPVENKDAPRTGEYKDLPMERADFHAAVIEKQMASLTTLIPLPPRYRD
jgi:hypothetical protein